MSGRTTGTRFRAREDGLATNGNTAVVPPQNLEAEESVLGAMMVSQATIDPVVLDVHLKAEDFYRDRHRTIFEAIVALHEDANPVDVLTVSESLEKNGALEKVGGKDVIASLAATVPAPGSAPHYARIVKQNSLMRRLDAAGKQIVQSVATRDGEPSEMVEAAERLLFQVAHEDQVADFREIGDILNEEIDKLEALATGKASVTGTPAGFRDLDDKTGGFQPGNLIIVAARPSMGKCLGGGTLIYDPRTGVRRRLDEIVATHEAGEEVWVASVAPDLKLRRARVSDALRSGRQQLYRLRTKLGRQVEATANHPLLTLGGWKELRELEPGSRIAAPRVLPRRDGCPRLPATEVTLLAALIADGSVGQHTPIFHFGEGAPLVQIVKEAAEELGADFNVGPTERYACLSTPRGRSNPVTDMLKRHAVFGKRAEEKSVPDAIFGLDDGQIIRFLSVLYACDGHVYAGERFSQIGYSTISERLARDVQHLLLRFGIVSAIRTLKRDVYEGTEKTALEVRITEQRSLARFATWIPVIGKEENLSKVLQRLAASSAYSTNVDTAPSEVWEKVLAAKGERPWADVSEAAGYPRNHNWHVGKRGLSRPRLFHLSEVLESQELLELADSDIWWDEVASIEELGVEETYDLTVPVHHNFVADDVIVHNSALVCNIAENVAIKERKPVAMFSLEMSEMELAHRFIGSQARIAGDRLRKGRISTRDWPKVVKACNKITEAPLWIDDSSDLGMLELRAKARRLHAQEKARGNEGLGLIIVDYMQLMRSDDPRANRVEQVAQFSRGLKILARELSVPVVALSQLSRAPEQRGENKRPILSDLRESGSIEQDADLVFFIYRDEYYKGDESEDPGIAELIIAKHRNGPIGTVRLAFMDHYPKFADPAHSDQGRPVEQPAGEGPPMRDFAGGNTDRGEGDFAEEG